MNPFSTALPTWEKTTWIRGYFDVLGLEMWIKKNK